MSIELKRILALPVAETPDPDDLIDYWMARLGAGPGAKRLYLTQAQALQDASRAGGGLFGLDVGAGKTLLGMLLGAAMGAARPVVLVPSSNVDQTSKNYRTDGAHFNAVPPRIIAYEVLSSAKTRNILHDIKPDLIIADEGHLLSNLSSARTMRLVDYMDGSWSKCRFVAMSGSFMSKSISEYAHLAYLALREGTPLPQNIEMQVWLRVLDAGSKPAGDDVRALSPLTNWAGEKNDQRGVRRAYRARLHATEGVVWSRDQSCTQPLHLAPWKGELGARTAAALAALESRWELPDGDPLVDSAAMARARATLPYGVFAQTHWDAVGGKTPEYEEWDDARLAWARCVTGTLQYEARRGLDSHLLVELAAAERRLERWKLHAYDRWMGVKAMPAPPVRYVAFDPEQLDLTKRAIEALPRGTLVWYASRAVASTLLDVIPVYGAGDAGPEDPDVTSAVSVYVHGTGWHAAHYRRNLILTPGFGVKLWQQVLGRTHRGGQTQPVCTAVAMTTKPQERSFYRAKEEALVIEDKHGQPQKIAQATWHTVIAGLPGWSRQ